MQNRDGWKVRDRDAKTIKVADVDKRPNIIVTNPPFAEKKQHGKRIETSAVILDRLLDLAAPGALLGVVLTQSLLDSGAGKDIRKKILEGFDILEIDLLPGGVFYSQADSVVIMLRKREKGDAEIRSKTVYVREVRSKDLARFSQNAVFTRTYSVRPEEWRSPEYRITLSPLADLWERLAQDHRPLKKFVKLRNGLQVWREREGQDVSAVKRERSENSDVPYIDRLDVLRPYAVLASLPGYPTKWLHYGPHLRRPGDPAMFRGSKVLLNATRSAGSAWRLVAAVAAPDLYFADRFHGAVPTVPGVSLEHIAAVLNSPLANAWFDANCRNRKVVLKTLNRLPFPTLDPGPAARAAAAVARIGGAVVSKWRRVREGLFYDGMTDTTDTARLLGEIDQMVYDAYGLTDFERRQVDKLMASDNRPS